ncbi:related to GCY1 - galactose-induced protein of aldo/keto reductase family [Cephalotrichum gorgonifer]|uniref:Related to GCY1 - galactose-induced protein of aldo/keto reductase family n=1 Tax=Cephalotrichum gorgonifer TaxID=2041049 RepID=A0AAE8MYY1_9PEZI|nr:related to GCY1 - galactose-induced protein of aldo/keto reductase family [Cephalotrichum gorgonifer]
MATICTKTFELNNGKFSNYIARQSRTPGGGDEEALESSIIHALHSGYRLIDTAQTYKVEHIVGRAIRKSGIPRSEITVVTKLRASWHHDPAGALQESLAELDIDYIDVFLMHWPMAATPEPEAKPLYPHQSPSIIETWKLMEKLVSDKCRAIGVSNFTQKTLDEILATATVVPVINQVELHALNPNLKLVPYCESKGIHVMSWSTLGGPEGERGNEINQVLKNKLFVGIAEAHGVSTAVVSLSWAVQRGITVIPKSSSKARIEENIKLVTLTDEEMDKINNAHLTISKLRISDTFDRLWLEMDGKRVFQGWNKVEAGWEDEEGNWLL